MGQTVKTKNRKTEKLLYLNARSILSKLDLLQIQVSDNKPELIAVCESFTHSDIGDALLGVEGYELISRKDGRDMGNVGVYLFMQRKGCRPSSVLYRGKIQ